MSCRSYEENGYSRVANHLALIARVSYSREVSSEWKVSVLSPLTLVKATFWEVVTCCNGLEWVPCGRVLQSYKSARFLGGYWKHARERPLHNLQSCLETRWQVSLTYHCLSFIAPSYLFWGERELLHKWSSPSSNSKAVKEDAAQRLL